MALMIIVIQGCDLKHKNTTIAWITILIICKLIYKKIHSSNSIRR
nr:MAG TPA: hypothetical protein [Myoviridae sp. ctNPX13]